jgi:hypothetical protein
MSLTVLADSPFVGHLARENELAVVETAGELICKSLRGVIVFKQVIVLLFGGGLTAAVWFSLSHPAIASMPWFATALMATLALVCWLVFFRNLLGTPFFTVNQASGEILLFRRRTREPWKRIHASEILHFNIEKQFYIYDSQQAENAVLLLFTTAGERCVLCGSPNQQLIRFVAEKLEQLTGKSLHDRPAK